MARTPSAPAAHPDDDASVSGRVLRQGSEEPVPDVEVYLRFPSDGLPEATRQRLAAEGFRFMKLISAGVSKKTSQGDFAFRKTKTGPEGRYAFERLPPGIAFRLQAGSQGEIPEPPLRPGERRLRDLPFLMPGGLRILLRRTDGIPIGNQVDLRLTLSNGATYQRRLLPEPGQPDGVFSLPADRIDRNGIFPGPDSTYRLTHPQLLPREGKVADLPFAGGWYVLEAALEPGRRVSGILLGPDGNPCAGYVYAGIPDGAGGDARPGASGRFEIANLPPGKPLKVHAESPQGFLPPGTEVPAGLDAVELTLRLTAAAEISGTAFDAAGNPLVDANLVARWISADGYPVGREVRSDASGRFTLGPLPGWGEASVGILARPPSYLTEKFSVLLERIPVGTRDLRIQLPPAP